MAPRGTLDGRVARLEEAIANAKEDRVETRVSRAELLSEIKDIKIIVNRLSLDVQTTGNAVAQLTSENCGQRLTKHDERLDMLENRTQNLPIIESEVMFWRRVLGNGFHALWKVLAVVIGSGAVGGVVTKWIWPH
jgi:hypothetical protein